MPGSRFLFFLCIPYRARCYPPTPWAQSSPTDRPDTLHIAVYAGFLIVDVWYDTGAPFWFGTNRALYLSAKQDESATQ